MHVELIAAIKGLPLSDIDPVQYLRKDQEKVMIERVKDMHDFVRANILFLILSINEYTIIFSMKVLSCKCCASCDLPSLLVLFH